MSIYSPKIILGIDPGYDRVGVGIIKRENNKDEYIYSDCIVTDKNKDYSERLQEIYISLNDIIKHYNPSIAVIEDLFFTTNQKTVIKVAQARGVIMLACIQNKLITQELTPLQIKMSLVGNGRAEKSQVAHALLSGSLKHLEVALRRNGITHSNAHLSKSWQEAFREVNLGDSK